MGNLLLVFLYLVTSFKVNGEITEAKYGGGRNHSTRLETFLDILTRDLGRTCPNPNGPDCGMYNSKTILDQYLHLLFQDPAITVV